MKKESQLEPGLLNTYRLLSWFLVGISTIQTVSIYLRIGIANMVIHPLWILPFGNLLTLGLLYWPWIRKKTRRFFIPILVVITTVSSILTTYLTSLIRANPSTAITILVEGRHSLAIPFELYELSFVLASWQLIPVLIIPLIMVAWQYNFKAVLAYIISSTLLDAIIFLRLLRQSDVFISAISVTGVLITRVFTFIVVGYLVSRMMAAQRAQRGELRHANQQMLGYTLTLEHLATSRERNRLARELHDTLAHTLSSLAVQLGAIKALWGKDQPLAKNKLEDAIVTTRDGLDETRRALKSLRAAPLEDLGLELALRDLAASAAERSGAALTLDISKIPIELPPDISQAFYRAGQEILENIVRHSNADQIAVKMAYQSGTLTLEIQDNGSGFIPDDLGDETFGLRGIQERAGLIGGKCVIKSGPGSGTTVRFSAGVKSE